MSIKLLLIIILSVLIIFVGYKIFYYYKLRKEFFENLCDFCACLQSQINYLKNDLCQIINSRQGCYGKPFWELLNGFANFNNHNKDNQIKFSELLNKLNILSEEEKQKLCNFFDILGKSNQFDQLAQISCFKNEFALKLAQSEGEIDKKGKTAIKLGALLSLTILIIFI